MSSYLLVCIVGLFEYVSAGQTKTKDGGKGVLVGGYAPKNKGESIRYFLELARESLEFYSDYFGIPYPLKKLDLVSLHSLNVRAMENWGCVTFHRKVFLCDPRTTSAQLM